MRLHSLVLTALLAAFAPSAFGLAVECDHLLQSHPRAQKAIDGLLGAVNKTKTFAEKSGALDRLRFALSRTNEAYRALAIGLVSAKMTRKERARVCRSTEDYLAAHSTFTTHETALVALATEICDNSTRKVLGVAWRALKTALRLGRPAEDSLEATKLLMLLGSSFSQATARTSLPRKQWAALEPVLDPLNFVLYRLRVNRVDTSLAIDLAARHDAAAQRQDEIDWSPEGAERLVARLLYYRLDGEYVPLVVLKPIFDVLNARSREHFDGRSLQVEVARTGNAYQKARAELFFADAVASPRRAWKEQRAAAQRYRALLENVPLGTTEDLILAFTVGTMFESLNEVKAGDNTNAAIQLKALAEVYFPALHKRAQELPRLRPTLAQVRTILELWTQFPELADSSGYDVEDDVLGLQLSVSSWASSALGSDLRDVMQLHNFEAPKTPAGERMKKIASRVAFDMVVMRGDGNLRWLDLPDIEGEPRPSTFDFHVETSSLRLLYDLRASIPAPERSEAALLTRAVALVAGSEEPAKIADMQVRRTYEAMMNRFGTDAVRIGLFRFLQARAASPNKKADIVVPSDQAPEFLRLAEVYGFSTVTRGADGVKTAKLKFDVKVE